MPSRRPNMAGQVVIPSSERGDEMIKQEADSFFPRGFLLVPSGNRNFASRTLQYRTIENKGRNFASVDYKLRVVVQRGSANHVLYGGDA